MFDFFEKTFFRKSFFTHVIVLLLMASCGRGGGGDLGSRGGKAPAPIFGSFDVLINGESQSLTNSNIVLARCEQVQLDLRSTSNRAYAASRDLFLEVDGLPSEILVFENIDDCNTESNALDISSDILVSKGLSQKNLYIKAVALLPPDNEFTFELKFSENIYQEVTVGLVESLDYIPYELVFIQQPLSHGMYEGSGDIIVELRNEAGGFISGLNLPLSSRSVSMRLFDGAVDITDGNVVGDLEVTVNGSGQAVFSNNRFQVSSNDLTVETSYDAITLASTSFTVWGGESLNIYSTANVGVNAVRAGECSAAIRFRFHDNHGASSVDALRDVEIDISAIHQEPGAVVSVLQGGCDEADLSANEITDGKVIISQGQSFGEFFIYSEMSGLVDVELRKDDYPMIVSQSDQQQEIIANLPYRVEIDSPARTVFSSNDMNCGGNSEIEYSLYDRFGNSSVMPSGHRLALSSDDVDMQFFAGEDCSGAPITHLSPSEASGSFRFRSIQSGNPRIDIRDEHEGGVDELISSTNAAGQLQTITPSEVEKFIITTAQVNNLEAGHGCHNVNLSFLDQFDNVQDIDGEALVAMTFTDSDPSPGVTFYRGSGCSGDILPLAEDTIEDVSTYAFSFRREKAGSNLPLQIEVTLDDSTVLNAPPIQQHTVIPSSSYQLAFVNDVDDVVAGSLLQIIDSGDIAVEIQDQFGNRTAGSDVIEVSPILGPASSFMTGSVASVAAVNGLATFSNLRIDLIGSYQLRAESGALEQADSSVFAVDHAPVDHIYITNLDPASLPTLEAGKTCQRVDFEFRDVYGNIAEIQSHVEVLLEGSGFSFFNDDECTSAIVGGLLLSFEDSDRETFYFRANISSDSGINLSVRENIPPDFNGINESRTFSFIVEPSEATQIVALDFPSTAQAGICYAIRIQSQDDQGNPSALREDLITELELSFSGASATGVALYQDATECTDQVNALTSYQMAAGENTLNLWLRSNRAGILNFEYEVDSSEVFDPVISGGDDSVEVTPAQAHQLVITSPSSKQTKRAGVCSEVTFEVQDEFGNTRDVGPGGTNVNFSGSNFYFFENELDCGHTNGTVNGGSITSMSLGSSFATGSIWFLATEAMEDINLEISSIDLENGNIDYDITHAVATHLSFLNDPFTNLVAGVTSPVVRVQVQDDFSNRAFIEGEFARVRPRDSTTYPAGFDYTLYNSDGVTCGGENTDLYFDIPVGESELSFCFTSEYAGAQTASTARVFELSIDVDSTNAPVELRSLSFHWPGHEIVPASFDSLVFTRSPYHSVAGENIQNSSEQSVVITSLDEFGNRTFNSDLLISIDIANN